MQKNKQKENVKEDSETNKNKGIYPNLVHVFYIILVQNKLNETSSMRDHDSITLKRLIGWSESSICIITI